MILPNFNDFPRTGRIIGIDWGARRTGVAISDETREFVFVRPPIMVGRGGASVARQIADFAVTEKVVGIVIGLPRYMDGSESDTTNAVRACAVEIATYTDLPIVFIDENLTSRAAQDEMGRVRVADIKRDLDSAAARVILENAIAMINRLK